MESEGKTEAQGSSLSSQMNPHVVSSAPVTKEPADATVSKAEGSKAPEPQAKPVTSAAAPPAPIRRGRGTFNCQLRTETTSSFGLLLPASVKAVIAARGKNKDDAMMKEEKDKGEQEVNDNGKTEESGSGGLEKRNVEAIRTTFGDLYKQTDSLSLLLFNGEKRRRTCVFVGDLRKTEPFLHIRLGGCKVRKPWRLRKKHLRLLRVSVDPEDDESPDQGKGGERKNKALIDASVNASNQQGEAAYLEISPAPQGSVEAGQKGEDEGEEKNSTLAHHSSENASKAKRPDIFAKLYGPDSADVFGLAPVDNSSAQEGENDSLGVMACRTAGKAVLAASNITAFADFMMKELITFLTLDDVRRLSVSIRLSLGQCYSCASRSEAFTSLGTSALTIPDFVHVVSDEMMELYFLRDSPEAVKRAVKKVCEMLEGQSSHAAVKITLVSDEGQRTDTRATWSFVDSVFRPYDTETMGVSLNWSVFPFDPVETSATLPKASHVDPSSASPLSAKVKNPPGTEGLPPAKANVFPFEIEMRAFRRWKDAADHSGRVLLNRILPELSKAEERLQVHNDNNAYRNIDLYTICQADYGFEGYHIEKITVERTWRKRIPQTELIVDTVSSLVFENFSEARRIFNPQKRAHKIAVWSGTSTFIHWKLKPQVGVAVNAAPIKDAVGLVQKILAEASIGIHREDEPAAH